MRLTEHGKITNTEVMMDRDKKIGRIVRDWSARGLTFGTDSDGMRLIAAMAVDAADGPEEWGPDDTIPTAQSTVYDDRQIQWHRQFDTKHDSDVWAATLRHGDFQDQVGTVYERPVESTDRTHGARVDDAARAYLNVLADTAAVLDNATDALAKTGRAYRDKRGFTAGLCRTAEVAAEQTGQASATLKDMIKEAEGQ